VKEVLAYYTTATTPTGLLFGVQKKRPWQRTPVIMLDRALLPFHCTGAGRTAGAWLAFRLESSHRPRGASTILAGGGAFSVVMVGFRGGDRMHGGVKIA
jgi:hypothetical protein